MSKKISFFDLGLYAGGVTSMFLQLMNTLKIPAEDADNKQNINR